MPPAGSARAGRRRPRRARRVRGPPRSSGRGSTTRPDAPGYDTSSPDSSPSGRPWSRSATTTSMPIASARVRTTSIVWGRVSASTTKGPVALRLARRTSVIASAAAVASSSSDALAVGRPGQVGDDGLEVEQRLEPALGDLRLVRRVGGVPARVLQHVAADHRRGDRAVVAQADHRLGRPVAGREAAQLGRGALLGHRGGQVQDARRGSRTARPRPSGPRARRTRSARAWWPRRRRGARCDGRRTGCGRPGCAAWGRSRGWLLDGRV